VRLGRNVLEKNPWSHREHDGAHSSRCQPRHPGRRQPTKQTTAFSLRPTECSHVSNLDAQWRHYQQCLDQCDPSTGPIARKVLLSVTLRLIWGNDASKRMGCHRDCWRSLGSSHFIFRRRTSNGKSGSKEMAATSLPRQVVRSGTLNINGNLTLNDALGLRCRSQRLVGNESLPVSGTLTANGKQTNVI